MKKIFLFVMLLISLPAAGFAEKGAVSAADPRAAAAGQQMLREGGSAADAALAMMLALTVVEPQSSGIGGGGWQAASRNRHRPTRALEMDGFFMSGSS